MRLVCLCVFFPRGPMAGYATAISLILQPTLTAASASHFTSVRPSVRLPVCLSVCLFHGCRACRLREGGDFVVSLIDSRTSAAQCTIAFTADTQTQTNWGERGREGGRDF